MRGLAAFQNAPRRARFIAGQASGDPAAHRVAAQVGSAQLLHYGGDRAKGAPVVFVPSLINPPYILDLAPDASLLGWLAGQGIDAYLLDWGMPGAGDATLDLAGHVRDRLLPLLRTLSQPPIVAGYCLGGTLAAAVAAIETPRALAMIAAPWRFGGFSDAARSAVARLWADAKPACEQLGYVPMEVLQSGFWELDPARTIRKYADFADMAPDSAQAQSFIALEDWANEGAPLTLGAGTELFEALYAADDSGRGYWDIGDVTAISPDRLSCPTLSIVSSTDRIVPAAASAPAGECWTLDLGHVGMIVGRRAQPQLWRPLLEWLSKHAS